MSRPSSETETFTPITLELSTKEPITDQNQLFEALVVLGVDYLGQVKNQLSPKEFAVWQGTQEALAAAENLS